MLRHFAIFLAGMSALGLAEVAKATPSNEYYVRAVKTGDRLNTIFSKTVSIKGSGFDDYVKRVSGTASDEIAAVAPDTIQIEESYRYDGAAEGHGAAEIRDGGSTICSKGACSTNDQTSGSMFIPLLWGKAPADISVGSTWTVAVSQPWEIGPAGQESVRVVRLDPQDHLITLRREGHGSGPSSDDAQRKTLTITSNGKPIEVKIIPHDTHWEGLATFRQGVTVCDEIVATRDVTLEAPDGAKFEGQERVYTLLIGAA